MHYIPESSSLQLKNVQYRDTAEYHCVINGQHKRSGIMKLIVQGMYLFVFFALNLLYIECGFHTVTQLRL